MNRQTGLRRGFGVLTVSALAGGAMSACIPTPSPDANGTEKAELRLGITEQLGGWDPALMLNGIDRECQWRAVFDTLLQCDQEGGVFSGAAEEFGFVVLHDARPP